MKKILPWIFAFFAAAAASASTREFFVGVEYGDGEMPFSHGADYYDNILKDKYLWELSFDEWFNGPNFSGGWIGARRKLENIGFYPVITYLGNFAANPVGGNSKSATNTCAFYVGYGLELEKLTGS